MEVIEKKGKFNITCDLDELIYILENINNKIEVYMPMSVYLIILNHNLAKYIERG